MEKRITASSFSFLLFTHTILSSQLVVAGVDSSKNEKSNDDGLHLKVDPAHPNLVTSVPYKDCGSKWASLTKLTVDPPCNPKYCVVKRGEPTLLIAHFLPRTNSTTLRVQIDQVDPNFGFSTHLFPEFSPCGSRRNISCPIENGEMQYSYVLETLPKSMIPFKVILKVVAMTEDHQPYLCILTPVHLV